MSIISDFLKKNSEPLVLTLDSNVMLQILLEKNNSYQTLLTQSLLTL